MEDRAHRHFPSSRVSEFSSWLLGWCYDSPFHSNLWWWLQYPRAEFNSKSQKLLELLLSFHLSHPRLQTLSFTKYLHNETVLKEADYTACKSMCISVFYFRMLLVDVICTQSVKPAMPMLSTPWHLCWHGFQVASSKALWYFTSVFLICSATPSPFSCTSIWHRRLWPPHALPVWDSWTHFLHTGHSQAEV